MEAILKGHEVITVSGGTAGVAAGEIVIAGELVGVAPYAIAANSTGSAQLDGIFDIVKTSGATFSQGAKVYFSASTRLATATTTDTLIGYAAAAAADTDTVVTVVLK